jgi:hypothetical protein
MSTLLDPRILLKCFTGFFFEYFLCLEAVTNCSDGGVIGMVPGVIGCLQVSYFFSFFILYADDSQTISDPDKNFNLL